MEEITVSAKTLDDAITEALIQLGVTSDKLDYDVIEKGSSGFLGIGAKQAVVKARRKVEEEPVKEKKKQTKNLGKKIKKIIEKISKRSQRQRKSQKQNPGKNQEKKQNSQRLRMLQ